MFGYVTANLQELSETQRGRYSAVYCGICRAIREQSGGIARLTLRYDMAFLALLLLSLYEPPENTAKGRCVMHPLSLRSWTDSEIIRYCADMNVALAYFQCMDDWKDEGKHSAKWLADRLAKHCPEIKERYPRQWQTMDACLKRLTELETAACSNPDEPAACFGELMGELLVYREDHWTPVLRQLGQLLGRFVYLMDAAVDYRADAKKGCYNPYLAMGQGENSQRWEEYLVNILGRCTEYYERLPLVQDKDLLDNILYSGVWVNYRRKRKEEAADD